MDTSQITQSRKVKKLKKLRFLNFWRAWAIPHQLTHITEEKVSQYLQRMSGSSKKISMSNRKIFEILRLSLEKATTRRRTPPRTCWKDVRRTVWWIGGQNYCIITKVQVKRRVRKSRVEVVMEWNWSTRPNIDFCPTSRIASLDQVQCTHLWRHFRDQRAKHSSAKQLLTCTVLERIMSFHFAERTFLIRSVQELLLKCHERSHPLNEISRKIVKELLTSTNFSTH